MKFEIMVSILIDLLSKRCVSAKSLATKYGVSVRSIYRYVESLEQAGIPIYTIRGNNGGIALVDTYKLSSTFLTEKEFQKTIEALTSITNSISSKELESVIQKLKATVKKEYTGFDIKTGNLIIDASPWGDTLGYKNKLSVINKAIDSNNQLKIVYHDRNGTVSERIIDPHVIVFKQGVWYVYAFCHLREDFRFFKIGRIENATIQKSLFARQNVSQKNLSFEFWENSAPAVDVELEVNKSVLSDVEEWVGIENVYHENGKILVKAKFPFDNGLVSKIIGFGKGIKVNKPKELKIEIIKTINDLIKLYK